MKDTLITAAMKRRELLILLVCFVVANLVNWFAIIKFDRPWWEVFTQVGYMTVTTLVLYGLVLVLRGAWHLFVRLAGKK